jgi:hypothetical protein
VDWSQGFPIQDWTFTDAHEKGNNNGVFDVGDLATQVQRSATRSQESDVNEMDLRYSFDWVTSRLAFGANYRETEVFVAESQTQQDLGSWGMANPGDVEMFAPGMVEAYCLSCQFSDYPVGDAETAFRADAALLFPDFQAAYSGQCRYFTKQREHGPGRYPGVLRAVCAGCRVGRHARSSSAACVEETDVSSSAPFRPCRSMSCDRGQRFPDPVRQSK